MAVTKKKPNGNRSVPLRDIIAEEAHEAEQEANGKDMEFDPDRDLGSSFSGPNAFRRNMQDHDQLVIDELLASLPKNQGYYLKLYREIMPGKWELKETINDYEAWTDMELEIAERVKAMTRKFGSKKWGSGLYRVVVWRQGGIREKNKYPPNDIIVDAGDTEDAAANIHTGKVDPVEAANEQLHALGNMLAAVQNIMPKSVDPNTQFQAIVQAFTAGKEEKREAARQDNNAMVTMMTTMMTSMMTLVTTMMQNNNNKGSAEVQKPFEDQMATMMNLLKSFGVMGQPAQPKTIAEQLTEMKLLGFDPFQKEDTIDQITKLKAMTGALVDILPSNGQQPERPGIFEKLIDSLAPHVPKIFADMKAITENAALAQKMQQIRLAAQGPQPIQMDNRPTTSYGQPVGPRPNRMGLNDAFSEPPDMDPYSGFQTRPFQDPTESDAGIREEMTGSVGGATPEELRARYTGQQAKKNQPVQQPVQPPVQEPVHAPVQEAVMPDMLQQLYYIINENIIDAYGSLYEALDGDESSSPIIQGIKSKMLTGNQLVEQLAMTGYKEFSDEAFVPKAQSYLDGFVNWVLENTVKKAIAVCDHCDAEHVFDSLYEFSKYPSHQCGVELSGMETCNGKLALKEGAKHAIATE